MKDFILKSQSLKYALSPYLLVTSMLYYCYSTSLMLYYLLNVILLQLIY